MPTLFTRRRVLKGLLGTALSLPLLPACSQAQTASSATGKTLIAYLSRTRNTEAVARMIQAHSGGDLFEIRPAAAYPQNYQACVDQVQRENSRSYLPPLVGTLPDLSAYDTVFVGFPTWGMQLPPPVKSFLAAAGWHKQTILPFNTHAGYGAGNSFDTIRAMRPQNKVLSGLSLEGGYERRGIMLAIQGEKARAAERQVSNWLNQHHISNKG